MLDFSLKKNIPFFPKFFSFLLHNFSEPIRTINALLGKEDFSYPATSKSHNFLIKKPNLIHAHNLYPNYFDFRSIKNLSLEYPLLITAHDCWLMTGHCAHPFECIRFTKGCGACPDLRIPPAIKRDRTKENLNLKVKIFSKSKVFLATPSRWLKEMFEKSKVGEFFEEIRVIPNGVDTDVFLPLRDQHELRNKYNLPYDATVFIFVANKITSNPWKNFKLMLESLQYLGKESKNKIFFLCVGEVNKPIYQNNFSCIFLEHIEDQQIMNELYNSADYYIHLAKADTFPNTILEAQASGLPVFANPICGIIEQIVDKETGWFIKSESPRKIAHKIKDIISENDIEKSRINCRKHILNKFCVKKMISQYSAYYKEILESRN